MKSGFLRCGKEGYQEMGSTDQDYKISARVEKNQKIRVRLLMTTGCIEYWLMLHFKMFAPSVLTEAEKKEC